MRIGSISLRVKTAAAASRYGGGDQLYRERLPDDNVII
jgi:hypothetical protein